MTVLHEVKIMKLFLTFLVAVISFNVYAYDASYNVSGLTDDGMIVDGIAFDNDGGSTVEGQLTDENGSVHSFSGHWTGDGQIKGETDSGDVVDLRTRGRNW
jgi:hypothetical protein